MKLTCLKCQYKGLVDATAAFMENGVMCPRCGSRMAQLLWDGSQLSALSTSTVAPTLIDLMNQNQNLQVASAAATAPGPESGLDDVLEIPRILQPHDIVASEQALVLDDVIPLPVPYKEIEVAPVEEAVIEETAIEESAIEPPLIETQSAVRFEEPAHEAAQEAAISEELSAETLSAEPMVETPSAGAFDEELLSVEEPEEETIVTARPAEQNGHQASTPDLSALTAEDEGEFQPELFKVAQDASFDYDKGRVWVRMAPIMLLVAVLAFFALYYLGNSVKERSDTDQNSATSAAVPESPSAAPAESAPAAGQQELASTAPAAGGPQNAPPQEAEQTHATESAGTETAKPVTAEQPANPAEPVRTEAQSPAPVASATIETVPAPVVSAPPATTAAAPQATQGSGNLTVQLASYNKEAQASERVERLHGLGVEARVVRAEIPRRGTWYRVQVGRFANREEAARFGAELRNRQATQDFIVTDFQN